MGDVRRRGHGVGQRAAAHLPRTLPRSQGPRQLCGRGHHAHRVLRGPRVRRRQLNQQPAPRALHLRVRVAVQSLCLVRGRINVPQPRHLPLGQPVRGAVIPHAAREQLRSAALAVLHQVVGPVLEQQEHNGKVASPGRRVERCASLLRPRCVSPVTGQRKGVLRPHQVTRVHVCPELKHQIPSKVLAAVSTRRVQRRLPGSLRERPTQRQAVPAASAGPGGSPHRTTVACGSSSLQRRAEGGRQIESYGAPAREAVSTARHLAGLPPQPPPPRTKWTTHHRSSAAAQVAQSQPRRNTAGPQSNHSCAADPASARQPPPACPAAFGRRHHERDSGASCGRPAQCRGRGDSRDWEGLLRHRDALPEGYRRRRRRGVYRALLRPRNRARSASEAR